MPPVMLAVTNTSPRRYLVRIEQIDLLRACYGQVRVTFLAARIGLVFPWRVW
jgi:hypothetical protein